MAHLWIRVAVPIVARADEIGGMDSWKGIGLVVFPFVFNKIRLNIVQNCL